MKLVPATLRMTLPFLLAAALAWIPAARADASAVKVATIDMGQLMEHSEPGMKLLKPLKELIKHKQAEDHKMEEALKRIRAKAAALAKTPHNEHQLADLQREFNDKMADMRSFEDDANQEVSKKRYETLSDFNRLAMPIIQSMGKELGYTMIFRKEEGGLLYVDDSVDITNLVIQRLNAQAASGQ